ANYSGDAKYGSSSGSLGGGQRVLKLATSVTISSSLNPSNVGEAVTFTAAVNPTDGEGVVSFSTDGSPISGCSSHSLQLVSGSYQATCTTSSLTAGNHAISATYGGDAAYESSTALLGGGQSVLKLASGTTILSSTSSSTYGQTVTFTAIVNPTDGGGTAVFSSDGSPISGCGNKGLQLVSGSYQATCITSSLTAGNHAISATYSGDPRYGSSNASLSGGLSVFQATSTTNVISPRNPSSYGQPVKFTAIVSPTDGGGAISFSADGSAISGCQSLALVPRGGFAYEATCTISSLAIGVHTVGANYSGDTNAGPSIGSLTGQSVKAAATTLSAKAAFAQLSPLRVNEMTLTALLTVQWSGAGLSNQPLVFSAGPTILCSAVTTNASGSATCANLTSSQQAAVIANNGYKVSYAGTTNYISSNADAPLISTAS
ncbi:MAG: Ig-like domain-containing protein, partial [Actinobacteria bacterium]|nr:Ig-like domain-containing protein [Actinomycetota bacterium]